MVIEWAHPSCWSDYGLRWRCTMFFSEGPRLRSSIALVKITDFRRHIKGVLLYPINNSIMHGLEYTAKKWWNTRMKIRPFCIKKPFVCFQKQHLYPINHTMAWSIQRNKVATQGWKSSDFALRNPSFVFGNKISHNISDPIAASV